MSFVHRQFRTCCSLIFCSFLLVACGSRVELYSKLQESDANAVIAALLNAGIAAERIPGKEGVAVRVPSSDTAAAVDLLRARGLPPEQFQGMGDVFRKEGLISSPTEERARLLFAMSQELANTISHIDGVLAARVHLVLPEKSSGGAEPVPSSAAVFIKYNPEVNLDAVQPQIRRLVSNSIPSLDDGKVSLVMVPAHFSREVSEDRPPLSEVLGFRVVRDSSSRLAVTLVVLALLAAAGIGGSATLAWLHFGRSRQKKAPAESAKKADSAAREEGDA